MSKKKKTFQTHPRQVLDTEGHEPMSDADFILWIAEYCGQYSGKGFALAMSNLLEAVDDGALSIKQYEMLESAIKKSKQYCILYSPPQCLEEESLNSLIKKEMRAKSKLKETVEH